MYANAGGLPQHRHFREVSPHHGTHSAPLPRPDFLEQRSTNSAPIARPQSAVDHRSPHPMRLPDSMGQRSHVPSQYHTTTGSGGPGYPSPTHALHPTPRPYPGMYPNLPMPGAPSYGYARQEATYPSQPSSRSMYPNLPMGAQEISPDRTVEIPRPVSSGPNNHGSNPPPAHTTSRESDQQHLATRRAYFMKQFKGMYGEDKIRKVFEMFPNETSEQTLHQRLNLFNS